MGVNQTTEAAEDVLENNGSLKFYKIDRKTPISGYLFSKVVAFPPATLIKMRLQHM